MDIQIIWKRWLKPLLTWRNILGILGGALLGFLYWYFIGCSSGTCPITSNPWMSILWGTLLGWIITRKNL